MQFNPHYLQRTPFNGRRTVTKAQRKSAEEFLYDTSEKGLGDRDYGVNKKR